MCLVISRLALTLYKFWATWENGPYGKFEQRRPGSDCAFAQSDPGLLCSSNYVKVFRNSVSVQRRPWSICAKWRLVRVCVACKGHFLLLCMKFVGCLLQEISDTIYDILGCCMRKGHYIVCEQRISKSNCAAVNFDRGLRSDSRDSIEYIDRPLLGLLDTERCIDRLYMYRPT